jgi:hypothetical protein
VSLLPRIDQLWYKYIHMEEMVKETAKARLIFDRWMAFEPDHAAWMAYIKVCCIVFVVHGAKQKRGLLCRDAAGLQDLHSCADSLSTSRPSNIVSVLGVRSWLSCAV